MHRTLVLFQSRYGSTEEAAKLLALILGPTKICHIDEFKELYKGFDLFVLGTPIYSGEIAPKIAQFIEENLFWLRDKDVVLFCLCLDRRDGMTALANVLDPLGLKVVSSKALGGRLDLEKLKDEDYQALEVFHDRIGQPLKSVNSFLRKEIIEFALEIKRARERLAESIPPEELKPFVEDFLKKHNTCTLATGFGNQVRATPIEYSYNNGKLYLLSEGGEKFANILLNDRVSLAIYDNYQGMDKLAGMQITGRASIVDPVNIEYEEVLRLKGQRLDKIIALPFALNMIRIEPEKVEFLNAEFQKIGHEIKQILSF